MIPERILKTAGMLALAAAAVPQLAWAQSGIPIVPVSVVANSSPATPEPKIPEPGEVYSQPADLALNTASTITMRRGVNELLPIAQFHLNRIVTPFSSPVVKSTTQAETSIEDNVVYVTTAEKVPVTLFISEEGSQDVALNITLVPRLIPSREIFLQLEEGMAGAFLQGNAKAERWEKSQPYVEAIRTLFRGLALGDLPQGYSLGKYPAARQTPNCLMDGLEFSFRNGQLLTGHNMQVSVGVVQNTSNKPIEIREAVCGGWEVAAVAAWPDNMLEPGQKSEIYVAERMQRSGKATNKRPSLLGGQ